MSLKVALQMDPIETIDVGSDSTYALGIEAQNRGHQLYHYLPKDLSLEDGRLFARARKLTLYENREHYFDIGPDQEMDIGTFDIVLLRQDPPFNMAYITSTHLLEHAPAGTLVMNNPEEVRNAPEKLLVTHFSGLMPPTLISRDLQAIREFREKHKDIILKPLFGNGGAQVFRVEPESENLNSMVEMFGEVYPEPIMVQAYLPEVRQGDKRIILIDGKPSGAIMRIPAKGESRANLHVGGTAEKTALTEREQEICDRIGPELSRRGLVFAGIDVIGHYLTEINVTSPTGLPQINALDDSCLEAVIWDAFEKRHEAQKS